MAMDYGEETGNFRQVGRLTDGVLLRSAMVKAAQKRTAISIPSKFETTLITGDREKNAFGNRTHRFLNNETAVPGPGTYDGRPPPLVRNPETCGSVSHRGYGGFASKSSRMGAEQNRMDYDNATAPGPGDYEAASSTNGLLGESRAAAGLGGVGGMGWGGRAGECRAGKGRSWRVRRGGWLVGGRG